VTNGLCELGLMQIAGALAAELAQQSRRELFAVSNGRMQLGWIVQLVDPVGPGQVDAAMVSDEAAAQFEAERDEATGQNPDAQRRTMVSAASSS